MAAVCLMAFSALAPAQQNGRGFRPDPDKGARCEKADSCKNNEGWKERMKAEKMSFFKQELQLPDDKAEAFWSVYDEISRRQWLANKAVMDSRRALEEAQAAGNSDYKALLDKFLLASDELHKVHRQTVAELRKLYGDELAAKVLIAEEKFRRNQIHRLNKGQKLR